MEIRACADLDSVVEAYLRAKTVVLESGFEWEVDWQYTRSLESVDERAFLSELAWVVLAAGLSDRVVRKVFPHISSAFCEWHPVEIFSKGVDVARREAYQHFAHAGKLDAICEAVLEVVRDFPGVIAGVRTGGVVYLRRFRYIGPVTAYHLAKNIGLDVCKPDRHLLRLAAALGFNSVEHLCAVIAERTADRVSVIDIVLWRFLTLCRQYDLIASWSTDTSGVRVGPLLPN